LIRFNAIWRYLPGAPGVWTDLTPFHKSNTAFNFIAASTEVFYFGMEDRRFIGMMVDLSTIGNYGAFTFEFFNGYTWENVSIVDNYSFNVSKFLRWICPDNWSPIEFTAAFPYTEAPPDAKSRYWFRISTASVTAPTAIITKMRCIPMVTYTTPAKVGILLNIKKKWDLNSTPTIFDVEDHILHAESEIDYRTQKSWKFNYMTGEDHIPEEMDYNRYGVFPRYRDIIAVYSAALWNGSVWQNLNEGRSNDFVVDKRRGMIYVTRLFLLPASYGFSGRYFHYGFGEFKNSMKIDYSYGRDCEIDPEFRMVEKIATTLTAIDLLMGHDYSILTVSGTDKVLLAEKVRMWGEEAEKNIDSLTSVRIY